MANSSGQGRPVRPLVLVTLLSRFQVRSLWGSLSSSGEMVTAQTRRCRERTHQARPHHRRPARSPADTAAPRLCSVRTVSAWDFQGQSTGLPAAGPCVCVHVCVTPWSSQSYTNFCWVSLDCTPTRTWPSPPASRGCSLQAHLAEPSLCPPGGGPCFISFSCLIFI